MGMKSSPAIAAGKLFVGAGSGEIFVFGGNELIADAYGPYNGYTDNPIEFTASAYGGVPEYSWYWEFGDGDTSTEKNPLHQYNTPGEYEVILTVTDSKESISIDYTNVIVTLSNTPPNIPSINGLLNGKIEEEYEFEFNSIDPDGDNVKYYIDWGDNKTELTKFYNSGEKVMVKHIWFEKGSYEIKAKAVDIHGYESDWGTFEVTMPKGNTLKFNFPFLCWLFEKFPNVFSMLRYML
jgi:PKD repeat protein